MLTIFFRFWLEVQNDFETSKNIFFYIKIINFESLTAVINREKKKDKLKKGQIGKYRLKR